MGGQAFVIDGLKAPRIPTTLYGRLKLEYTAALAQFYENVVSAPVARWKIDHGDVDMLVEGPRRDLTPNLISEALGARAFKDHGPILSFAMPHPEIPDSIVQLDVQLCPQGYLRWQTFQASNGDLGQIIGVIIRDLGLTATDKGLFVRIAEMESSNKKASMVYLTHDPDRHVEFLGLDSQKLREGFDNEEELFQWVAGCRFLNRHNIVPKDSRPVECEKHNDRARRQKRGMYRAFVEEFIIANLDLGKECQWDREKVLDEALDIFGRREDYESRLSAYLEQEGERALWAAIKESIPRSGPSMKTITKGLQRFVSVTNGKVTLNEHPVPDDEKKPWIRELGDAGQQGILDWVSQNWEAVRLQEKAYATAKKAGTSTVTANETSTGKPELETKKRRLNNGTKSVSMPLTPEEGSF